MTESGKSHGARNLEDTARHFWATRPRRPVRGRKVAGVAAAIGNRYGIDPVIVRVGLVVATVFGGVGVVVYLLGWLFLPGENDEVSAAEALVTRGRSSVSPGLTILLAILLIPASSFLFRDGFSVFAGFVVVAGLLFLLHYYRGGTPEVSPPPQGVPLSQPQVHPFAAPPAQTVQDTPPAPEHQPTPEQPPAWDPLGVAPFAWDLPEPTPPPAPPAPIIRRPRSKVTAITVGVAFLVGGLSVVLAPHSHDWLTLRHGVGLVLGVLGLGLVAGSFVRGGKGLILLVIPLAILGLISSTNLRGGVGGFRYTPTTLSAVKPSYPATIGEVRLDLSALPLKSGDTVTTSVDVGVGDARVTVPRDARVQLRCASEIGGVNCLNRHSDGLGQSIDAIDDDPPNSVGTIVLDVHVGTGDVRVQRA